MCCAHSIGGDRLKTQKIRQRHSCGNIDGRKTESEDHNKDIRNWRRYKAS